MRIVPRALALFITSVFIGSFAIADEPTMEQRVNQYATVKLTSDLSHLSDNQKKMVSLLIDAAEIMDGIFWQQAWGTDDLPMGEKGPAGDASRRFVEINYGPWDRLGDNKPFIEGIDEKPEGAAIYPTDMTAAEFEKHLKDNPDDAESFKTKSLIHYCRENLLASSRGARTPNQHRWAGREYQGDWENYG